MYHSISQYNAAFEGNNLYLALFNFNILSFTANYEDFLAVLTSITAPPDIIILTEHGRVTMIVTCVPSRATTATTLSTIGVVCVFWAVGLNTECFLARGLCNDVIKACTINIKLRSHEICVVSLYHPQSWPTNKLFILLHSDKLMNKKFILAGDFNIDLLKQDDNSIANFLTNLQSLSFCTVISKPTRFPSGNQTGNL